MIESIDDDLVMIIQEDTNVNSTVQLQELDVGDKFIFRDEIYGKISNDGWYFATLNVLRFDCTKAHIHPTTVITLIQ